MDRLFPVGEGQRLPRRVPSRRRRAQFGAGRRPSGGPADRRGLRGAGSPGRRVEGTRGRVPQDHPRRHQGGAGKRRPEGKPGILPGRIPLPHGPPRGNHPSGSPGPGGRVGSGRASPPLPLRRRAGPEPHP
jgi:hypothetical protein